MILGLTPQERADKLVAVLTEVLRAVEERGMAVWDFDVDMHYGSPDEASSFEITFEIDADVVLIERVGSILWGKHE